MALNTSNSSNFGTAGVEGVKEHMTVWLMIKCLGTSCTVCNATEVPNLSSHACAMWSLKAVTLAAVCACIAVIAVHYT